MIDLPFRATVHCKLWLLEYESLFLRIVISSANLNPIDWNGMTENFWYFAVLITYLQVSGLSLNQHRLFFG